MGRARAELLLDQAEVVGKARVGPRRAGAEAVLFLLDRLLLGLAVVLLDRLLGLAVVLLDRLLELALVGLAVLLDLVALVGLVVLLLRLSPTPLSVLQGRGPLPHSGGAACS